MSTLTLEEICTQYVKVSPKVLDQECTDKGQDILADYCGDWEEVARKLFPDTVDNLIDDVGKKKSKNQRSEFVRRWREEYGHTATYKKFFEALLELKFTKKVENALKKLKERKLLERHDADSSPLSSTEQPPKQPASEHQDACSGSISQQPPKEPAAGDKSKLLPLSCFDWEDNSLELSEEGVALNPSTDDKLWPHGSVLKVYFMRKVPAVDYDGDWITKSKIIEWMNEWSDGKSPSSVPKFEITAEIDESDVRLDFIEKDGSHSYMGRDAKKDIYRGKATMNLNLNENGPNHTKSENYKKYLVLHETGHALGFDHEHQHPAFGEDIFRKDVVKQDLMFYHGILPTKAETYYITNFSIKAPSNQTHCPSDKDSVMKYSAPKKWIKEKFWKYFYNDDNVDTKGYSWPMSALDGELTSWDKEYANKVYKESQKRQQTGGSSNGSTPLLRSTASINTPTSATELESPKGRKRSRGKEESTGPKQKKSKGNRIEADSSKEIDDDQAQSSEEEDDRDWKDVVEEIDNTRTLKIGDIKDVMNEVRNLAGQWEEFAQELGIESGNIGKFKANRLGNAGMALNDAVSDWLKKNYDVRKFGKPNWRTLANAVQPINDDLALTIAKNHPKAGGR